jgi:sortase A
MFRRLLFVAGIAAIGYYGYSLANQYIYQDYENWSFDQQIAGRSAGTFTEYVRERTPFGPLLGATDNSTSQPATNPVQTVAPEIPHGAILGRVSVPRLGISAMVRQGVDAETLSKAVGHVPSTALPGERGNFSIAAHRDTLFRALRGVRIGDRVDFQSTTGTFAYRVIATQIVRPSDVSVLRSDGGPAFLGQVSERPAKLLTMITCYPFNYIGSAPERFIVQAKEIDNSSPPVYGAANHPQRTRVNKHRRITAVAATRVVQHTAEVKPKRRGFWHRIFHLG